MNLKSLSALGAGLLLAACSQAPRTDSLTQYVDMRIGTGGHGHVFMGANVPFGAVQLGPTSIPQSWDWTSGYHISDTTVIGFSHTHLNGTGIGDLFDVTVMPVVGQVTYARGTEDDPQSGMWSYFSHANEKARPGYYATRLDRYGIDVELTATKRVGLHKYTFPASADAAVVFDLENGGCWDAPTETFIERADDHTISGYRYSTGWAKDQRVYFTAEFSKPFKSLAIYEGGEGGGLREGDSFRAERLYGRVGFDTSAGETIYVKVAISPVSIENARLNMQSELPGWDFEATAAAADRAWDAELQKVRIETSDDAARRIFYTALYHALIHPNLLQDVNGQYPAMESNRILTAKGDRYTVFSLWDTYRNVHQLLTLVYPERQLQMVRSMLDMYREHGWLPKWELYGRETLTMEGDPSIPVIVDTWLKGLRSFDVELAYEAMRKGAVLPGAENLLRPDNDDYLSLGYVPLREQYDNSVSHALEYYIADNALSRMAEALAKDAEVKGQKEKARRYKEDARLFYNRSLGYKHYYSKEYGTFRPILPNGEFYAPFDPRQGENFEPNPGFHEGCAWNYTFYVPHDVKGLAQLMGGKKAFVDKLQRVFDEGLYDPANEPDIAYAHLFSYFKGEEWRTQKELHRLLQKYFKNAPDGIPGNDDTGTMSAWAIFNMMGFYPDCPGEPSYTLSTPVFDKVTIRLDTEVWGREQLVIETERPSDDSLYIREMELGGKRLSRFRISHQELVEGGKLRFVLR